VRRAGERTLPLVQKYVDDIVTVEEEEIANAILLFWSGRKRWPKAQAQPPSRRC
jgi:threonine dehydratase